MTVLKMEHWKPIEGYEGYYEVSNCGRIRAIARTIHMRNGVRRKHHARVLAQSTHYKSGYKSVMLSKGNEKKRFLVHRLVAEAFIENRLDLPEVNHKDENKSNNNTANLEWCDRKYNNTYGTAKARSAVTQGHPVKQIGDGGSVIAVWPSQGAAARATGATQSGISACLRGKAKKSGGYSWMSAI